MLILFAMAHASVLATLSFRLPGGAEVVIERDTANLPSTGMSTIQDHLGRTWEVFADVDDRGSHAFVVVDARVSSGGKVIERFRPEVLVALGDEGEVQSGTVLPFTLNVRAERTSTAAPRALERSYFLYGRKPPWRIRTFWPRARVNCYDPGVRAVQEGDWLVFEVAQPLRSGQSNFSQCQVDGAPLDLWVYAQ